MTDICKVGTTLCECTTPVLNPCHQSRAFCKCRTTQMGHTALYLKARQACLSQAGRDVAEAGCDWRAFDAQRTTSQLSRIARCVVSLIPILSEETILACDLVC